jgi:Cu-Zn family superoxide dismutase
MIMSHAPLLASLAAIGAAVTPGAAKDSPGVEPRFAVHMKDGNGKSVGTVEIRQLERATVLSVDLRGLPPGAHGFHIHERGRCDPPDFKSAGEHMNPQESEHGYDNPRGYHAGDLPNLHVDARGTVKAEVYAPLVVLDEPSPVKSWPLRDLDGSALVVHAHGDDYRDMKSAGDRIACGVIPAR